MGDGRRAGVGQVSAAFRKGGEFLSIALTGRRGVGGTTSGDGVPGPSDRGGVRRPPRSFLCARGSLRAEVEMLSERTGEQAMETGQNVSPVEEESHDDAPCQQG